MIEAVGVLVPVHDEAELLPACLASIQHAFAAVPATVTCELVVVLDACSDDSKQVATRAGVDTITCAACNVGRARALGTRHLLERFTAPRDRIWIATTDADTRVPRDWLANQLRFARAGAQAVAGTIAVDDWTEHPPGLAERFARHYTRGGARHGHIHGANLGIRADAYVAAGGFAAVETGEDHALWNALAGRPRIATRRIPVVTSARRQGRAPAGFAGFLVALAS